MSTWPTKDPAEIIPVLFDFALELTETEAVASAVLVVTVVSGTDANPSAMLSGAPTLLGKQVKQVLIGGVTAVTYLIRCEATISASKKLVLTRQLPVLNAS